ncbi:type IV pilin protein [Dyella solisilvae]|nr:type IV pilin protein [Dyella solisilvae]
MSRNLGFTLIELMIVVAIVAVLAAVAIPAYGRYAYRARRVDGQTLLLHIAQAQERYYAVSHHYGDLGDLGFGGAAAVTSKAGHYQAEVTLQDIHGVGQGYVATATPQGVQVKDACGALSMDNTGQRSPDASRESLNINGRCW